MNEDFSQQGNPEDSHQLETQIQALKFFAGIIAPSDIEVRINQGNDAFFRHDTQTIVIGAKLVEKFEATEPEKEFIYFHELAHFVQYMSDPTTYKEIFELIEEKAKGSSSLKRIWGEIFFNRLLDIHSNAIVRRRSTIFDQGESQENTPQELYDKLFQETEMSANPLSSQLINYLIMRMMSPQREININPQVLEIINKPFKFLGKDYSGLEEYVRQFLYNPETKLRTLLFSIKHTIMPIYEELLKQDIDQGREHEILEAQADPLFERFDPTNPDNFSDVDKYINEKNESASERSKRYQHEQFNNDMRNKGFTEEQIYEMCERKKRTDTMVNELKNLWWMLIQQSTSSSSQVAIPGFTSGSSIDPQAVLAQIPIIMTNPSEAQIFKRSSIEEAVQISPKKISFNLAIDASGSMFEGKGNKINEAKDVLYAISQSLVLFYKEGKLNNPEFPVEIDLNIVAFGTEAKLLLSESINDNSVGTEERIWRGIGTLMDMNTTKDSEALKILLEQIRTTSSDEETLKILFEITDGETKTPDESTKLKRELEGLGTIAKAVQIVSNYNQQDTFKRVWGEDGLRLHDINDLKKTIEQLLVGIIQSRS